MLEVGARVHHALVQPELIEVVADVVVVANGGPVARLLMALAQRTDHMFRPRALHRWYGIACRQREQMANQCREGTRRAQARGDLIGEGGGFFHVALEVQVAGEIGFDERQLAWRQEHAPERPASVDAQAEGRTWASMLDRAVPVPDVHRTLCHRAEERLDHRARVLKGAIPVARSRWTLRYWGSGTGDVRHGAGSARRITGSGGIVLLFHGEPWKRRNGIGAGRMRTKRWNDQDG